MILGLVILMGMGSVSFGEKGSLPTPSSYEGKWFAGTQDTDYRDYDLALRKRLIKRIDKRFGLKLDLQTYTGFDLLEMESLLRLKKSNEPVEHFLRMFPKSP